MSVNAQITLAPEARRALARIERFPDAMGRAIAATLDRENEMTVGRSVEHYLSGPRPRRLGVRSGRLRRSAPRLDDPRECGRARKSHDDGVRAGPGA